MDYDVGVACHRLSSCFWCTQVMTGKTVELLNNSADEMIKVADDMIREARNNDITLDRELVRKLYEVNGLLIDV